MADDFMGLDTIGLQPLDSNLPYTFEVTVCSSATANDGAIPFGLSVTGVVVVAYSETLGTDVTATMIQGTPTVSSNIVTVDLNWPGAAGRYKLTFKCTLTGGLVKELDFTRISALDK